MNDIFIEQLVKAKRYPIQKFTFILLIFFVVLIPVTFMVLAAQKIILAYFVYIAVFLLFFGIWLIWFVRSHQNIEYEYQMVQDTLVVSKIIAKRKRKELLKLDVRTIDVFDKSEEISLDKYNFSKTYDAAEDTSDDKKYYVAIFRQPVRGECCLLFSPNEKILNAMKPYLNKDIVLKLFYNRG